MPFSSPPSTYIADFRKAAPVIQQSLARLLGAVNYCNMPQDALEAAVNCLLESVDKSVGKSAGYDRNN